MQRTQVRSTIALLCTSAALIAGCSKPSSDGSASPAASAVATPAPSAAGSGALGEAPAPTSMPSAARSVADVPAASPSTGALHAPAAVGAPSALSSASAAPSAVAPSSSVKPPPESVHYASTSASGSHFTVAVSARTQCAVGAECAGTITLTASDGYHINDEYPYRFAVDGAAGAEWLAADGKGFGKTTGDFKKTSATTSDLAFRYRGKQAGNVRLSGTYRMSVCSEANCQLETVPVVVDVTFR